MSHAHGLLRTFAVLIAVPVALGAGPWSPPARADENGDPRWELVTRFYRVEDLFVTATGPGAGSGHCMGMFSTDALRTITEGEWTPRGASPSGLFYEPSDDSSMGPQGLLDLLMRVVNSQADPRVAAWADEGGHAIAEYWSGHAACTMIVNQTPEAHKKIEDLLGNLRRHSPVAGCMLTIRARWLAVDEAKVEPLLASRDGRDVPVVLDAEALKQASARTAFRGVTTTFDGMNVCLSAGTCQNYVAAVERVSIAQGDWTDPERGNAFSGGFLHLCPRLDEGGKGLLVDYVAHLTTVAEVKPRPLSKGGKPGSNRTKPDEIADRVRIGSQRLHGSVRIPLDETVLLGLTTGPDLKEGTVYALVVEVSASD